MAQRPELQHSGTRGHNIWRLERGRFTNNNEYLSYEGQWVISQRGISHKTVRNTDSTNN